MAQVFRHNLEESAFWTIDYGNCRAVETVENELHVFPVPTALGKLGKNTAEFPTVPTASTAGYRQGKRKGLREA